MFNGSPQEFQTFMSKGSKTRTSSNIKEPLMRTAISFMDVVRQENTKQATQ